jgi:hypothetical protein
MSLDKPKYFNKIKLKKNYLDFRNVKISKIKEIIEKLYVVND